MQNTYEIKPIESNSEIQQCLEVALVLRPHLNKDRWSDIIAEMVSNEKYTLMGIFDHEKVIAFIGYRIMTTLHSGNMIYIDDLCTLESYRGRGLASQLLSHVRTVAEYKNMDSITLDTGFDNHTAQKLYFKNGFKLSAVHLHSYLK
ncbi:GNAT family N-acetyltransferase [Chryseobacterium pennae]|uniref:GNAT family N-acetyltransferase n=1 Tax=Chryseobacterium pennae TaxID=2258962 RepID=A0A3D9C0I4_9FLAO|nr:MULTISPECIES: GNAT family N-acetyltransferase [Chryseobacterium]MCS4302783.1 ribosomal protein S18 acetylase RimI-like enzyme [Chryseobacterium sp. BIGb0232]REC59355.1 GNAT family N-acetyltransferase [Chryseobacterium pennae]ROS17435.1 acetyltransferase (GNAT) family protein [Chryseobacterium nakagawai]